MIARILVSVIAILPFLARAQEAVPLVTNPGGPVDADPAERLDFVAAGAVSPGEVLSVPGVHVVADWTGFEGKGEEIMRDNIGVLPFPGRPAVRGRVVFKEALPIMPWSGRAMSRVEHPQKALNTTGTTAIILPGSGHLAEYELAFGSLAGGSFIADRSCVAAGFVVANLQPDEGVVATFYSQDGEVLSTQTGTGDRLEDGPGGYQGREIFFGWVGDGSPAGRVHRITLRLQRSNAYKDWSVDALAFSPPMLP